MKTLIVHPEDPTTTFLSQIYAPLPNKTVAQGGVTKPELRSLIEFHERILMLGHGSPYGLLNLGQFPDAGSHIIDDSMVLQLKNKTSSIFIWCYADQFVVRHGLEGLCSGMFISEIGEADYYGFDNIDGDMINQSNERFVSIVSKYVNEPLKILHQKLMYEYGLVARTNDIARFNIQRLYVTYSEANKNPIKMDVNYK